MRNEPFSKFNDGLVLILDTTASGTWFEDKNPSYIPDNIQSIFSSLKLETIDKYKSLNKTRTYLEDKLILSVDYKMISPHETIDSLDYLVLRGIIDFTNVAFDELYKQSIVYLGIMVKARASFDRFLYLEKDGNNWVVKKEIILWIG